MVTLKHKKTLGAYTLKLFTAVIYIVPGKPLQPSLLFVGKAEACTSEAPFRCSNLGLAPGLTHKHLTRLERLARDKHSSLLRKSANYGCKKFYSTGPWTNE